MKKKIYIAGAITGIKGAKAIFDKAKQELEELKDNILSFTRKVSDVIGVDKTIDIADKADEINSILSNN